MLTIATIGGILLCVGALLTFYGRVFMAVTTYLFADICWVFLSYSSGDYQGVVFTTIGTLLCFGAFLKMKFGVMDKDLKHHA